MSYSAAIENLNKLIPELFTAPGQERRKFTLHEIGVLCRALGNPQERFASVLIAGTNGKGSTASTLAAIAQAAGVRTGLYTSPHLERANERVRVGEAGGAALAEIADEDFARVYFRVHDEAQALVARGELPGMPSYFELLTALAFVYFAERRVELAVLEVGMGGRLDATNLVEPLLSVITDISLDHQEWLGDTIAKIAREKAGILRKDGVLVTLPQHPEANQAIGEVAVELGVKGVSAVEFMPGMSAGADGGYALSVLGDEIRVESPLMGTHQHRNLALAIAAAVELAGDGRFPITAGAVERGIRQTVWPGRMERLKAGGLEWVLDVAHNPAGAWALRAALSATAKDGEPQTLVFACLRDKPLKEMAQILFPLFDRVVLAPVHSARATRVEELLAAAEATGVPARATSSVAEALGLARELTPAGRVVVSGSVYLVGEARHLLLAEGGR